MMATVLKRFYLQSIPILALYDEKENYFFHQAHMCFLQWMVYQKYSKDSLTIFIGLLTVLNGLPIKLSSPEHLFLLLTCNNPVSFMPTVQEKTSIIDDTQNLYHLEFEEIIICEFIPICMLNMQREQTPRDIIQNRPDVFRWESYYQCNIFY
ncbi:hypothetical protein FF38_01751 [Lucilia cuprina]|uniref:Uncharacterized protein n=1 Tax=Lucilia cuprina TaxID=7375 RepID=A0A0L0CC83_LUCCU|nr:hypothetical protein FF38_01751 [Lucilia cuprina]